MVIHVFKLFRRHNSFFNVTSDHNLARPQNQSNNQVIRKSQGMGFIEPGAALTACPTEIYRRVMTNIPTWAIRLVTVMGSRCIHLPAMR